MRWLYEHALHRLLIHQLPALDGDSRRQLAECLDAHQWQRARRRLAGSAQTRTSNFTGTGAACLKAYVYLRSGAAERAISTLGEVSPKGPKTKQLLLATAYAESGYIHEAGIIAHRVSPTGANEALFLQWIFDIFIQLNNFSAAWRIYQSLNSPPPELIPDAIRAAFSAKAGEEVLALIRELPPALRQEPALLEIEARTLLGMGQPDKVLTLITPLIREDTTPQAWCYGLQAEALQLQRKYRELNALADEATRRLALPENLNLPLARAALDQGNAEQASALLAQRFISVTSQLERPALQQIYRHRLLHDLEQLKYLQHRELLPDAQAPCIPLLEEVAARHPEQVLSYRKNDPLDQAYQRINESRVDLAAITTDQILNERDWEAEAARFRDAPIPYIILDNLLTDEALRLLKHYCDASQVWMQTYPRGYLGSFMNNGFHSRLLFELSVQLRERIIDALTPGLMLEQTWAFKYDNHGPAQGIPPHADFSQLNINLWITPDDALQSDEAGGLDLYSCECPADWPFSDYNANEPKIMEFVAQHHGVRIPVRHKQNRALVFNPRLFHGTGPLQFKPGYGNRRINITFLYGQSLAG
jgi:hypothetical protein